MSWNPLTDLDVLTEGFNPTEQNSLKTIQSADNLAALVQSVINSIRGYLIAGGNPLGPDGTIPDQLRPEAVALVRWQWLTSFPQLQKLQTRERKQENDDAKITLKEISKGSPRVELPAAGQAIDRSAPVNAVKRVSGNKRAATRNQTRGL